MKMHLKMTTAIIKPLDLQVNAMLMMGILVFQYKIT